MMDRLVWDSFGERTHLVRSSGSSVLSGSAGRVVSAVRSGDPARSAATALAYPGAVSQMAEAGWLGDGAVFRTVPRDPHLRRVQIEVSLRCNLRCGYCYSMSGPGRTAGLGADRVMDLITQADRLGVLTIDFTGGELLMDPQWQDYVTLARSAGIAVTVHTNGTLIRRETAEFLSQEGVRAVQVSLDSHLPEVNDAGRGSRGALKRTLAGLDLLRDSGLPTRLSVMAHKDNMGTLGATITQMAARYPRAILNVDRVVATGGALNCGNGLSAGEFFDFLRPYLSANVRAGRICESPVLADYEPECGMAYSYVYITAEGEIAACPTMTSREDPKFRGPSVSEADLAWAWYDSEFFTSFRYTNCENVRRCSAGKACGGGCRSNAYVEAGYVSAPDVHSCNMHKNSTTVFIDFPKRYAKGEFSAV
jgi:radical SAM protein with 4Fe4S-binding SPASM domain